MIFLAVFILIWVGLFIISDDKRPFAKRVIGENYLTRWHILPRTRFGNIYLHHFVGSDDDRGFHDHPSWSFSIRLKGRMVEQFPLVIGGRYTQIHSARMAPRFCWRAANFAHRLELKPGESCWTLFIMGPVIRDWGFIVNGEWFHWTRMTNRLGRQLPLFHPRRVTVGTLPDFWARHRPMFLVNGGKVNFAVEVLCGPNGYVTHFDNQGNRITKHGKVIAVPHRRLR